MDSERLDGPSREALCLAQSLAVRRGHSEIAPGHLLLALLRPGDGSGCSLLEGLGARPEELRSLLESFLERKTADYSLATRLSPALEEVMDAAERVANDLGSGVITPRHLLAALLENESAFGEMLRERGLTRAALLEAPPPCGKRTPDPRPAPFRDLTAEAAMGTLGPILGREPATTSLIEILLRGKHHPILLGEKGAGKSGVVEALACTLAGAKAPSALAGVRLFAVEPSFLEAEWDAWIEKRRNGRSRTLLHVDDPRAIAQAVRRARASASDTLPYVTFIGCATPEDYYGSLSRQPYLEGCLATIAVEPLSVPTTRLVLRGMRQRLEVRHDVRLRNDALDAATDLAARFPTGTTLPGAAIDLLRESAAARREELARPPEELARTEARVLTLQSQSGRSPRTEAELAELRTAAGWLRARWEQEQEAYERLGALRRRLQERDDETARRRLREAEEALPEGDARLAQGEVTAEDVARVVEKRSGARLGGLHLDARTKLTRIETNLGKDVLGQRDAMRAVASALMRSSVRLGGSSGPGASFWFVGPAGVGKTETARSLARHFLHDEKAIAIVSGDDARGVLGAVALGSRAVVLVRDADRVSPEVVRLLTSVLETGFARDVRGAAVDFRQAVLVMSSRQPRVGSWSARFDAVVEFGQLNRDIVRLLVDRRCRELSESLAARRVELDWTLPAMEWIAERGWNREEGLHRLHRVLADEVGSRLGRMIVLGELAPGSQARVEVREGRLEIGLTGEPRAQSRSPHERPSAAIL